jgi:hypothetical protein
LHGGGKSPASQILSPELNLLEWRLIVFEQLYEKDQEILSSYWTAGPKLDRGQIAIDGRLANLKNANEMKEKGCN